MHRPEMWAIVPGLWKGNLVTDHPCKISKLRMTCRGKFRSHNLSAKIECQPFAVDGILHHLRPPSPSVILASHIFHLGSDGSYNAALVRQIAPFHYLSRYIEVVEKGLHGFKPELCSHQPSLASTCPPSGTHCLRLIHIRFGESAF